MRVYRYRKFREETEKQIMKMINKGRSRDQIRDWLLDQVVNSEGVTGPQMGELLNLIPGIYRAAG